jgi:predicted transcriptional regulator
LSLTKLDEFDELTAVIRLMIYLYKHPSANTTRILKSSAAGQKAFYSAKKFLEENGLLETTIQKDLPYNPLYSLNDKGKKIAEHLVEIERILNC